MRRKANKLDYMTVKSYRVIGLLHYIRNVCEKEVADMLSEWCEINHVLHEGQIGTRRQTSVIDVVARGINCVQEA